MNTRIVKTVKIFLASSRDFRDDRVALGDFVMRLQKHYASRNYMFNLEKWEYIDPSYHGKRKQSDYNEAIKQCDLFIVLFHSKVGKYTREEFDIALNECNQRHLPLLIYFKGLQEQVPPEDIKNLQEYIRSNLGHYWGKYDNIAELYLDFVLWLDSYLYDGLSNLKTVDGYVTLGEVKVTKMSQLSFASNNADYKRMYQSTLDFRKEIEKLRSRIKQYPDDHSFVEELQQKQKEYNEVNEEFERYQKTLLDTAKFISNMRHEQTSEKLQRATEAFESGDLKGANAILREIAIEAKQQCHIENYEYQRQISDKAQEMVHQDIDAFHLQAQTEMADVDTNITDRIDHVIEIYAKADDWASRSRYNPKKYAQLLSNYASFLDDHAHYHEAEQVYLRQIALSEQVFGSNSPNTSSSYNDIGVVFYHQCDYAKALKYYFKALRICEQVLGNKHPETAVVYNNIGMLYNNQGDYDKALKYFLQDLDICKQVLGANNPYTAISYNNIGSVYKNQGEYTKALKYYFKALEIYNNSVLDKNHSSIAKSYNNIGEVYLIQKEYKSALKYHSNALNIRESILGNYHPDTAISFSNMGKVYQCMGDFHKALEFFEKALDIREVKLGKEHFDTKSTREIIETLKKSISLIQ
jgi:tetratricopeptide (TPR) repeat protein